MACARWHHAAPTGLAEISVGLGYKHVAPLGLVSFGGRPPSPTTRITDCRERTLAANPAFKESRASDLKRGTAVRVHPLVRLKHHLHCFGRFNR